jgi:hypothetical protein
MTNNELQHVGVLGMKWGRRKGESNGGGSSGSKRSGYKMRPAVVRSKVMAFMKSGKLEKSINKAGQDVLTAGLFAFKTTAKLYAGYRIGKAIASLAYYAATRARL